MKKTFNLLLGLTVFAVSIMISGCKSLEDISIGYDKVHYYKLGVSEDASYENIYKKDVPMGVDKFCYAAGMIDEYHKDGDPNAVQFIAAELNGIPVKQVGFSAFMNSANISHGSDVLEKIYVPSTVVDSTGTYFMSRGRNVSVFYCGDSLQIIKDVASDINSYNPALYVPAKIYSAFKACLADINIDLTLNRANVAYMFNADDMPDYYTTEYYYVDYVAYGEEIINVPPDPVRKGYKFDGWYTEPECENAWSSSYQVPELKKGELFKELRLYAKWSKN